MGSLRRRRAAGLGDTDDGAPGAVARTALDPGLLAEVLTAALELRVAAESPRAR